jgi:beta-lactamase class D OXA-50
MMKWLYLLTLGALVWGLAPSQTSAAAASQPAAGPEPSPGLAAIFSAEGATGTLVIRRLSDRREWVHDLERAEVRYLPASTFKIVNAAIALETGAITGIDEAFPWDGVERRFGSWNRDHTVASAMPASAVPVYQEIARRIGEDRMRDWLALADYGKADVGGGIDQFWLSGDLRISAREQVAFLERFVTGRSPFSPSSRRAVEQTLVHEQGDGWTLFAKTGWAFEAELGWCVGWVANRDETHVFALNMEMPDPRSDPPKRVRIGRAALVAVGALPPETRP